jgi:hypothetical protein
MGTHPTPCHESSETAEPEPIEMVLIRIHTPLRRLITRELRAVDRVLASWRTNDSADICCDFEIIFRDGYAFRGSYQRNAALRGGGGSFRNHALREFAKLQTMMVDGRANAPAMYARQQNTMRYELQAD